MAFTYSEFDGEGRFVGPEELFPDPRVMNFILTYGQQALDALPEASEQIQEMVRELLEAGLLEREEGGNLRLTPRMVAGMQHAALLEIFRDLKPGVKDGHVSSFAGRTGERTEGIKAYEAGEPLMDVAIQETLREAVRRKMEVEGAATPPIRLDYGDLRLHEVEAVTDSAVCVLIDLSGSMARYGRHLSAKKVALGLRALIRRRFPLDTVDFIGFASVARRLEEAELPLVMPEPITTRDWRVRVKLPLEQAGRTHPHFTNLQHALQLAGQVLSRRGAPNKQVFIITDGEPTAHVTVDGSGRQTLHLTYPPEPASAELTLLEANKLARRGIRFASFALIEEYHAMDWVGFVEQLTRLTRGVAYYCAAGDLASTIIESYLSGRRKRAAMG